MLTFNKNKLFFKKKIIILEIFISLSLTSCNLNILQNHPRHCTNDNNQNKINKLIIPKEINFPHEDEEYTIPYTEQDLTRKKIDILPPV
ncbi:hypothetical protein IX46_00490 [Buchnera aphidicola (Aphis glycines)]|uniref:Outer membrane protein assembly factor BamC n=1 Tax=Buchnera aphidicola (Aphis glycines) TaxID=1265350 RepID=A0A0M4HWK2_9GAMM|nr:hypothetical protein [Buchnera aphidicola]ALD15059.1 hypothetical protein IX46_00490 [Buchnera aphidicola (Aphis glycines)]